MIKDVCKILVGKMGEKKKLENQALGSCIRIKVDDIWNILVRNAFIWLSASTHDRVT
jgi:hypothetical protein